MQLVLLRHAKAADGSPDYARRLADHGRQQAKDRGKDLAQFLFDIAFVSGAARTKETFRLLQLDVDDVREDSELYLGSHETIINLVRELPESVQTVLIVGHEPTISTSAALLASTSKRVHEIRGGVSTSTAIVIDFDSWRGPGEITDIIR